jgi:hypothetical protein
MPKILICGSGPAAIQIGIIVKRFLNTEKVSILATRRSKKNNDIEELFKNGLCFEVKSERPDLNIFCDRLHVENFFINIESVNGQFDFVVFAQPTFLYLKYLKELILKNIINSSSVIVTASSSLGLGTELKMFLKDNKLDCSIVLLSDYLAVTTCSDNSPVEFTAVDKKTYLRAGILGSNSDLANNFISYIRHHFISELQLYNSEWIIEQANTNLFHLPLTINPSLNNFFFNPNISRRAFYAPYPDGALSFEVLNQAIDFEYGLEKIFNTLKLPKLNFLQFRISRSKLPSDGIPLKMLNEYNELQHEERRSLLIYYSWMVERQVLGLSNSDSLCSSDILPKYPCVTVTQNTGILPRVPLEDYATLKCILEFTKTCNIEIPIFTSLCSQFELSCLNEPKRYGYSLEFNPEFFGEIAKNRLKSFIGQKNM